MSSRIHKKHRLRARQKFGKYRIGKLVGHGGFANVYQASDTLEGIQVALKVPHARLVDEETLEGFKKEVRITASLDHPNILPIKNASFIEEQFVIAYPLGCGTLDERLTRRIALKTVFSYAEQLLHALAHAHERRVVHCDVKPDNIILFPEERLRLTDFGIAKVALRTLRADGTGTIGYVSPDQAFGKPSYRSDVFSVGLVIYRMLAGELPEWPFEWPFRGVERLRRKVGPDFIAFLRRSLEVDPKKRFQDARQMLLAFNRVAKLETKNGGKRKPSKPAEGNGSAPRDWKTVRRRQFLREYGKLLEVRHRCRRCAGPVSETMRHCPWCRADRKQHRGDVRFPLECPRCHRGVKSDWRFCPHCWGGLIGEETTRRYSDRRYEARCSNASCERKDLMPFMRYCPWCNTKVRRKWAIPGSKSRCKSCGWGVLGEFWSFCPWCSAATPSRKA